MDKSHKEKLIDHLIEGKMINKRMAENELGISGEDFIEMIHDISAQMQVHRIYNRSGQVDYWS